MKKKLIAIFNFKCITITKICSFIVQPHLFKDRETDRQMSSVLVISKLSYFRESNLWKMEVLQIFGLWDQETDSDSRVTNP